MSNGTWTPYTMKATDVPKGASLDLTSKAIVKAYKLAVRDQKPWYVGAAYTGPYLTLDTTVGQMMFRVDPDGTVNRKES